MDGNKQVFNIQPSPVTCPLIYPAHTSFIAMLTLGVTSLPSRWK